MKKSKKSADSKGSKNPLPSPPAKSLVQNRSGSLSQGKINLLTDKAFHPRLFNLLLPLFIILVIAVGIYATTLKNGFVYDDEDTIVANEFIKKISNLPKLFSQDYFTRSAEHSYRPVVTLTYFLDYAFYGLKPWGYHLTNIALHAINGILLYTFLTLIIQPIADADRRTVMPFSIGLPLIITLLFLLHPAQTEAVNSISYREDLLIFLFFMTTLILYIILSRANYVGHDPRRVLILYIASCISYLLALFSKEMAMTLPLMVYCFEYAYKRIKKKDLTLLLLNRFNMGYIGITLFYAYLNFYYFSAQFTEEGSVKPGIAERILTLPWLFLNYLKLSIFPISLSADYEIGFTSSFFSSSFVLPLIALAALAITCYKIRDRRIVFGILFFAITLSPVYNVIPLENPMAERYLYLPMAGFMIVLGLTIHHLFENLRPRYAVLKILIWLTFMGSYSFTAIARSNVWKDDFSLWSETAGKHPGKARARHNLGLAYLQLGQFDKAISELEAALKLNPNKAKIYLNLGRAYCKNSQFDKALQKLNMALELDLSPVVYYELGNVYLDMGKPEDAIKYYKDALRLDSSYSPAYNALGTIYNEQGRYAEALQAFEKAAQTGSDSPINHYNLGLAHLDKGMADKAALEFQLAAKLNPAESKYRHMLGIAYVNLGRFEESIREIKTAIDLNSTEPKYHYDLAITYSNQAFLDGAIREYRIALQLNSKYKEARMNLGNIYLRQGQFEEAMLQFQTILKDDPEFIDARYNLGIVYFKQGLTGKAKEEFIAALQQKPDYVPAMKAIESIEK